MILNYLKILRHKWHTHLPEEFDPTLRDLIEKASYPRNHVFFVCNHALLSTYKLIKWVKKISTLYPTKLESFLDLSCCRGFFVFDASQRADCQRSLGIDVDPVNIQICQSLKPYLKTDKPRFELLSLDKLAENIDHFGGAYQTLLLINMYQYLFFGSDNWPGYLSHEKIFSLLANVCSHRIIFSNRVELAHCQNKNQIKQAGSLATHYNAQAIMEAAEKYFTITPQGKMGRYPLWLLEKR